MPGGALASLWLWDGVMTGAESAMTTGLWPIAAVAVVAALLLALLMLRYRQHLGQLKSSLAAAQEKAAAAESVLFAAPIGCYAFAHAGGGPRCSRDLAQTLGVREDEAVDFNVLLTAFEPAQSQELAAAAERLVGQGSDFSLTLNHRDGRRRFEVRGNRAQAGGGKDAACLVWFLDVTAQSDALAQVEAERDDFSALLDALPLPVWARNRHLELIYCNRAFAQAVGRDRAEVLSEGIELPGTALAEASRALAGRALEEAQPQSETHHVVVSGERRLLDLVELPFAQSMLAGLARDLTPVEEVQGELDRHIDAHAEILESLGSGIAILGPDLRLKFFNNAYAQMFRLDEAFLTGEPHWMDILESLRERRMLPEQSDFPAYKEDQVRRLSAVIEPSEELLHIPDGSTIRLTITPHPFGGVLLSFEDVTDRLALERSYNTLIAVQRETLNNLYEGVAVYGSDGRLKLFNPAFARIWNLPLDFLETEPHIRDLVPRSRDFFDVPDEAWPKVMDKIAASVTEPEMSSGRHERADGSVLDTAQVPLPDGNCLFTFLDVTDSIRVERALRERNEALETTDRLKSEFLANVSYELRTPLNAIVGFAEILENQFFGELNERQLEYSRAIVESSQRLLALINDILDLATIEAGYLRLDLGTVDVASLLESIKTLGHERARSRGIEFELVCAPDVGELVADERRVKQALFNLVSNAFKFTPEGGRVTVEAGRIDGEVQLMVSDTGIGIPQEEHARVFGKFERGSTQGRQSGAGLGLSLVKSLIELHGGWVELESEPDQGTRVICHLPSNARQLIDDGGTSLADLAALAAAGSKRADAALPAAAGATAATASEEAAPAGRVKRA